MMRKIMVPLDGSPAAEHALPWAIQLARKAGASVDLVRVSFPPAAVVGADGLTIGDPTLYQTLVKMEDDYLKQITTQYTTSDVVVTPTLLDADDSTAGCLSHFVTTHEIDLTIMTTHGRGPFARFWLGSVVDEFLRTSHGPTLLLRAGSTGQADPSTVPMIKHVIVPLDGSDLAEQVIAPAETLARLAGADLTLILVLNEVEDIRSLVAKAKGTTSELFPPESAVRSSRDYLERKAEPLRRAGHKVHARLVERGEVTEVLINQSSEPGTLVSLATHGRGGLTRMLWGSVADKVVRGATGPVLVVRPREEE